MTDHRCGPPYPVKASGRCLCCGEDCYEVKVVRIEPGHSLDGHPLRLGPMLECGTQVEFLLSDGSEADVTFCLACALALRPEDYQAVWRTCVERTQITLALAGRSENQRREALAAMLGVWPIAVLRRRREAEGMLVVDRRG